MTDDELRRDFIRLEEDGEALQILVRTISWRGHTPVSDWVVAATIENPAADNQVEAAIKKLLRRRKFFAVCRDCGERKASGYMQSATLCQECAADNYRFVY